MKHLRLFGLIVNISIFSVFLFISCDDDYVDPLSPSNAPLNFVITSPNDGDIVSDTVTVTAESSSELEIVKVEFYIDGELITKDFFSPYQCDWNTTSYPGTGQHEVEARAYEWGGFVAQTSNVSVRVDNIPPSTVDDLTYNGSDIFSVTLNWSASGNDGVEGTATSYDIRYDIEAISESNWDRAARVSDEPSPASPGIQESFTVTGLSPSTEYYFAVKVCDEMSNLSLISNNTTGITTNLFDDPLHYGINPNQNDTKVITTADLDNDGDYDLALVNYNSDDVTVLLNNGNGVFSEPYNYAVDDGPFCLIAVDLDNDNYQDLVTANFNSYNISVLYNDGNGTFPEVDNIVSVNAPISLCAFDIDNDGDKDLAVTKYFSNSVVVILNNGDGTFQADADYTLGSLPWSVVAVDLNKDGAEDLAVANMGSNEVSVLYNDGFGSFQNTDNYETGEGPYNIFAVDLDNDLDYDLVTANSNSDDVSILLNDGFSSFQVLGRVSVGNNPMSIFASDVNNDEKQDLIVANVNSQNVTILIGRGNGTFNTPVNYPAGSGTVSVVAADFDNDSDIDLALGNEFNDQATLLLNKIIE